MFTKIIAMANQTKETHTYEIDNSVTPSPNPPKLGGFRPNPIPEPPNFT